MDNLEATPEAPFQGVDFDSLPEGDAPKESAAPAPFEGADFDSLPESDEEKPKDESTLRRIGAAVEGAAKGFAGPLATGVELGLSKLGVPGLSAEEQEAREKDLPVEHGIGEAVGLGTGLLTGVGELGLLAKAGEAAVGLTKIAEGTSLAAKAGSAAIKGFVEMGGLQAGDEVSKMLLGQTDPEAPVAAALANSGYSGLIGAGISGGLGAAGKVAGSGLKALADSKAGTRAAQFLEDFGSRWRFNQENPSLVDTVHKEISDFFHSTRQAADEVYGASGLKAQAIQKLVPEMNEAIQKQSQSIADTMQKNIKDMVSDPETFPPRLTKKLMSEVNEWMETATNPSASAYDVFDSSQKLKQRLQAYSKFDKQIGPLSPEKDFVNEAKKIQHELVQHLEDTTVWGKAGELQKGVNKAFTDFLPAQKDFLSKFTTKELGEPVIDPQKIKTYVNQIGKTGADISEEIRPKMMKNYIDAAEKYREQINDLHGRLGVESPIGPTALSALKSTYNEASPGSVLADDLFHGGVSRVVGNVAGSIAGSVAGHSTGIGVGGDLTGQAIGRYLGDKITPAIERVLGRPIKHHLVPAVLKALSSGSPRAVGEALEHAENIARGNSAIEMGINSVFTGSNLVGQHYFDETTHKDREKIKKYVEEGGLNKQIEKTLQDQDKSKTKGYAEGGEVRAPAPKPQSNFDKTDRLGEVYPEQNVLMNTAKARIHNYLNSVRPQKPVSPMPFDTDHEHPEQKRAYERAIDIAHKPLSVLNRIKDGTLSPEHVKHMTQMWPEVHNELAKKMTKKMYEGKIKGEKPPFHVRQALSMFVGSPLESTLTPSSIQAAQSVFTNQRNEKMNSAPASKTSKLSKVGQRYQTATQGAEARLNGGH